MQMKRAFPHLVILIVVSLVCGFVYTEVQQVWRMSANDPQIQMAEDAAKGIANGNWPSMPTDAVEISSSLAPFLMVFDKDGHLLATNAILDGHPPSLPSGVLDWTRQHGEDRITWQPRAGVRIALVIVPVAGPSGGFVASGRSMREVEKRIAFASQGAAFAWAVLLAVGFGAVFLYRRKLKAGNATPLPPC
jgi:hypothetical protein